MLDTANLGLCVDVGHGPDWAGSATTTDTTPNQHLPARTHPWGIGSGIKSTKNRGTWGLAEARPGVFHSGHPAVALLGVVVTV